MTVTRRSQLIAGSAAPMAGALTGTAVAAVPGARPGRAMLQSWGTATWRQANRPPPSRGTRRTPVPGCRWVSADRGRPRSAGVEVSFAVGATHAPPASAEVSVWDGGRYVPVEGARTGWATEPDAPPVITFDAVRGIRLRLLMAGAHPGEAEGALRISRLEAPTSG